eukprot:gene2984-biopygen595
MWAGAGADLGRSGQIVGHMWAGAGADLGEHRGRSGQASARVTRDEPVVRCPGKCARTSTRAHARTHTTCAWRDRAIAHLHAMRICPIIKPGFCSIQGASTRQGSIDHRVPLGPLWDPQPLDLGEVLRWGGVNVGGEVWIDHREAHRQLRIDGPPYGHLAARWIVPVLPQLAVDPCSSVVVSCVKRCIRLRLHRSVAADQPTTGKMRGLRGKGLRSSAVGAPRTVLPQCDPESWAGRAGSAEAGRQPFRSHPGPEGAAEGCTYRAGHADSAGGRDRHGGLAARDGIQANPRGCGAAPSSPAGMRPCGGAAARAGERGGAGHAHDAHQAQLVARFHARLQWRRGARRAGATLGRRYYPGRRRGEGGGRRRRNRRGSGRAGGLLRHSGTMREHGHQAPHRGCRDQRGRRRWREQTQRNRHWAPPDRTSTSATTDQGHGHWTPHRGYPDPHGRAACA